jgi:ectoine hydroxylase-related dioxygenase (phytanoyl-CoA dioxygenase family)
MQVAAHSKRVEYSSLPNVHLSGVYEALLRDGYVILPQAISPATTQSINAELAPHFSATPKCIGDFYGWKTTRVGGLLRKAPSTQALVLHPDVLAITRATLQPSCDCIQLNLTQAIRVHPQERAQAPHRDEEMWPHEPKRSPWLINVMWPLTEFTEENGATRLWPGSHNDDLDRGIDPAQSVAAEMRPGDALIFLGALTHGAGANRSRAPRDGIIVSYCLGWLKQYENAFLAYPPAIARDFPPELQRLIGYQIHRPNLGGWEGQDPALALQGARAPMPHVDALPEAIASELKRFYAGEPAVGD